MHKEAKIQYDTFLEVGDLQMLFPRATGDWNQDKEEFIKIYKDYKELLNTINVDVK